MKKIYVLTFKDHHTIPASCSSSKPSFSNSNTSGIIHKCWGCKGTGYIGTDVLKIN